MSIFKTFISFINSVPEGELYKTSAMLKYMRLTLPNSNDTAAYYQTRLKVLGFVTNVRRGFWKVNKHVPDWFDSGVMNYACGNVPYVFNDDIKQFVRIEQYHGKTSEYWKHEVEKYLKSQSMNKHPNIYQTLRRFLNNEQIGDNIRVAAMCDATDGVEVVTRWKKMNNNPKYTTRMYVSHLNTLGFLTRVKQGVYRLNAHIPDWVDLGVIWYARGYEQYENFTNKKKLYKGLTGKEWKEKVKEEVETYKHCLPSIETLGQVAPVLSKPSTTQEIKVAVKPTIAVTSKGKLTTSEWGKLSELFLKYCLADQRAGQAYMNALREVNIDLYNDVTASDADCFYNDTKIVEFMHYLSSEKLMKPQPKLGNHVRTKRHSWNGIVYAIHHNFRTTGESQEWLNAQEPKLSDNVINAPWVSILIDKAGSVLVPISDIAEITSKTPVENGNPWFSFYFDK